MFMAYSFSGCQGLTIYTMYIIYIYIVLVGRCKRVCFMKVVCLNCSTASFLGACLLGYCVIYIEEYFRTILPRNEFKLINVGIKFNKLFHNEYANIFGRFLICFTMRW